MNALEGLCEYLMKRCKIKSVKLPLTRACILDIQSARVVLLSTYLPKENQLVESSKSLLSEVSKTFPTRDSAFRRRASFIFAKGKNSINGMIYFRHCQWMQNLFDSINQILSRLFPLPSIQPKTYKSNIIENQTSGRKSIDSRSIAPKVA